MSRQRKGSRSTGSRTSRGAQAARDGVDESSCVAEVMGTELFTLTPDTMVGSALRLANTRRIHHFLVIEDGSLAGIVAQRDLQEARETTFVGACMKSPVLCVAPDTTVEEARDIMEENEVGCLPVVTGTFLVGMLTRERLIPPREPREMLRTEAEDVEGAAGACTACGSAEAKPYFRAGMLPLCRTCAELLPRAEPRRGN
jgi:CBS domain-containing protein